MIPDPYKTLGIKTSASDKDIKNAYRTLAKKYHPDINPGKKEAEENFAKISQAYEILSDKDKKAKYDRGEFNPQNQRQNYYRDFANQSQGTKYHSNSGYEDLSNIEDIFGSFFKGGVGGQQAGFKRKTNDANYSITLDFMEAALGGKKRITKPDGKILDISIPPGVKDGQLIRLSGAGSQGSYNEKAGDAFIEVHILPHQIFRRKNFDIEIDYPIRFDKAILGGKIEVPTIHGKVLLSVPSGSNNGTKLRIKGKAIQKGKDEYGDQFIILKIVIPDKISDDFKNQIKQWSEKNSE